MSAIDPRRGRPSASHMRQLENCPGSWHAAKDMPDDESADAAKGTLIHAALETGDMTELEGDEINTAEMCQTQTNELLEAWENESM